MHSGPFEILARKFGSRKSLKPGDPTFQGRRDELFKIRNRLLGTQVQSIWISGPRRVGKTSLALHGTYHENINAARFDCDGLVWEGIEEFCSQIVKDLHKQLGSTGTGSGKEDLLRLANKGKEDKRIVITLDEFDRIAPQLHQNEQAFLRKTIQDHPYFGFIFISRPNSGEIVQDFTEESSRLLGVLDLMRLQMLARDGVQALCQLIANEVEPQIMEWFPTWIYERIGGYPVVIHNLIAEVLRIADQNARFPSPQDLNDLESDLYDTFYDDLSSLWIDLPISIRQAMHDRSGHLDTKTTKEFRRLRFWDAGKPHTPGWIRNVGLSTGVLAQIQTVPSEYEMAERFGDLIRYCNDLGKRKGITDIFRVTDTVLKMFSYVRPIQDEANFNDRINTFHKILVEGTTRIVRGAKESTLPDPLRRTLRKTDGWMIVVACRNFVAHDPNAGTDEDKEILKRYQNMRIICEKYLGGSRCTMETPRDYNIVCGGIFRDVIESLNILRGDLESYSVSTSS